MIVADSAFISSGALPHMDSVEFVLLDSTEAQQVADEVGRISVMSIGRPSLAGDTARSGFTTRSVVRREKIGRMADWLSCAYRLRRIEGVWQIDSALGCVVT